MAQRIVVVGGGIATVRLVETLRRLGSSADITVVAGERHRPYDRPPLSKAFLQGDAEEPTYLRDRSDYDGWRVDLRLGASATGVRVDDKVVDLDDGTTLPYDDLVVATGAQPRTLPSISGDTVFTLRTVDDSRRLRAAMREAGRIVVVGAGFIGCEVASTARAVGVDVTLVDVLSAPLVRVLGDEVAAHVSKMHLDAGVELRMSTNVHEALGGKLVLSDGDTIDAPVTLVAIGVSPTTAWLEASAVEIGDGIVCDAGGRSSAPNVWAIGDVAAWRDPATDRPHRFEHWTSAGDQAVVVARNLTRDGGVDHVLAEVPYFWSDQHGIKLQSLGVPSPSADVELLTVGPKQRLLALYGNGGKVSGAVGFGAPKQLMRMRPLLAAHAPVDDAIAAATAD